MHAGVNRMAWDNAAWLSADMDHEVVVEKRVSSDAWAVTRVKMLLPAGLDQPP